jgi:hypothetical protein
MRVRDVLRSGLPMALPIAMIVSACSAAPGPTPSSTPGPTATSPGTPAPSPAPTSGNAATVLLRVTTEGGFIGPAATLAALPQVTVLTDGRILTPGAIDTIYPGPLVLPLEVRNVGPSGAAAILAAIRAAGLDKAGSGSGGGGGIPGDTGTTIFLANIAGSQFTNRLVLGGGLPGRPGGGASPDPAAAAASDLLNRLMDPTETWGTPAASSTSFVPVGFRVFVAPGAPVGDGSITEPTVAWPLTTSLDSFGVPAAPDRGIPGLRQGVLLGVDAASVGPLLLKANVLTPFASNGELYTLYLRVLLPDEVPAQG